MIWHKIDKERWLTETKLCEESPGEEWVNVPEDKNLKRARWDADRQEWYNGVSDEEQADYERKCKAMATAGEYSAINYEFTEAQTSETLNAIYDNVALNYKVLCPNIAGGKEYTKISNNQWRVIEAEIV